MTWYGPATVTVRDFGGIVTGTPCTGVITGMFGRLDDVHIAPHSGLDIAPLWTIRNPPVTALAPGRVRLIGRPYDGSGSMGGTFGNCVILEHSDGRLTLYGHMRELAVAAVGQLVERGELLGIAGTTGQSDGVHLHLGMSTLANPYFNKDADGGVSRLLDPLAFILAADPAGPPTYEYPVPEAYFEWIGKGDQPWKNEWSLRMQTHRPPTEPAIRIDLLREGRVGDFEIARIVTEDWVGPA